MGVGVGRQSTLPEGGGGQKNLDYICNASVRCFVLFDFYWVSALILRSNEL